MNIDACILAGGKNSRYGGRNKAFIEVFGKTIIDRNLEVLQTIFSNISIVTNAKEQFVDYNQYAMSSDYYHEIGPLAGIHSALKNCKNEGVFIASCDMPFLDASIIKSVLQIAWDTKATVVIPRVNDKIEPLFAFYHSSILDSLENHIQEINQRSIRSFLKKVDLVYLDLEDNPHTRNAFTNINRPDDLSRLEG